MGWEPAVITVKRTSHARSILSVWTHGSRVVTRVIATPGGSTGLSTLIGRWGRETTKEHTKKSLRHQKSPETDSVARLNGLTILPHL